jgi:hypothetical protein
MNQRAKVATRLGMIWQHGSKALMLGYGSFRESGVIRARWWSCGRGSCRAIKGGPPENHVAKWRYDGNFQVGRVLGS